MARDRLAAMRAQQGGGLSSDSAPTQYQSNRRQNPFDQRDEQASYEMAPVNGGGYNGGGGGGAGGMDMTGFFNEISSTQEEIRELNDVVARVSELHQASLNNMDERAAQINSQNLEQETERARSMTMDLKARVQNLERNRGTGPQAQNRLQQINVVKGKFKEAIQNYQLVEQKSRQQYKNRMERQFKIVKPDASPEEVQAVVNDTSTGGVFTQALMNSNSYGQSRAAYREVQERHQEIQKIEKTLAELAQLFNDMSILVDQQNEIIDDIERTGAVVEKDVEAGLGYTEKARDSARAARKKRIICFLIILIILIIVAVVIAVVVTNNNKK